MDDNPFLINGNIDNYKFVPDLFDIKSPLCVYNYGNALTSGLVQSKFYEGQRATNYIGLQVGRPQFDENNDMSCRNPPAWIPSQHGINILRKPPILPMFQ